MPRPENGAHKLPDGVSLVGSIGGQGQSFTALGWSGDGTVLALGQSDGIVSLWNRESATAKGRIQAHSGIIAHLAWDRADPCKRFITGTRQGRLLQVWSASPKEPLKKLPDHSGMINCLAWSPCGRYIASGTAYHLFLWLVDGERVVGKKGGPVTALAWSPDGTAIAYCSTRNLAVWRPFQDEPEREIRLPYGLWQSEIAWAPTSDRLVVSTVGAKAAIVDAPASGPLHASHYLSGQSGRFHSVAWATDADLLATGGNDHTVALWDANGRRLGLLEGHTSVVDWLHFAEPGLLISHGRNEDVRVWHCDSLASVGRISGGSGNIAVSHTKGWTYLALVGSTRDRVEVLGLDCTALAATAKTTDSTRFTSAKIALVGESNAGKSCLAMRLAEDRFPESHEQGTTHGMRFWSLDPVRLGHGSPPPAGERREIILWDMGGQEEYRLVHQLFLDDTAMVLVLFDPTRGVSALSDAAAWSKQVSKQLEGRASSRLLIGAKVDEPSTVIDQAAVQRLVSQEGFSDYIETSARTGRGIDDLKGAIATGLDWKSLGLTSRPALFQQVRDSILRRREAGEIVVSLGELVSDVSSEGSPESPERAVEAVAQQLALQGQIAVSSLESGERAVVLQVGLIERYAGSIILAARRNPRGVQALETRRLVMSDMEFPGLTRAERIESRVQERVVIECVTELLVQHGVCFRHEGLLVFPSLFPSAGKDSGVKQRAEAVSLYYEFSGAIDSIYASLVAQLAVGKDDAFGPVRLRADQAEFEEPGKGLCGVRKIDRSQGLAQLELFFGDSTGETRRNEFISFVEDHLARHGVEVIERLGITCTCGFGFPEETVRKRIGVGQRDIICPACEVRSPISIGADAARSREPELEERLWALRTEIEKRVLAEAEEVRLELSEAEDQVGPGTRFVLHLSDLHVAADQDVHALLRPLLTDLRGSAAEGGLGVSGVDVLVITGDLTNRATQGEFAKARELTSTLIKELGLSAEKVVVVPGNHDLDWETPSYYWRSSRSVDPKALPAGSYCQQGDGYLLRDAEAYPGRFKNFSDFFYHPLVQAPYPISYEDQGLSYLFPREALQFVAFNSAWEIDEFFPKRSSIHPGAVSRALDSASAELERAWGRGDIPRATSPLRVALWHHPVTGNEKIQDDAFLEQLRREGIRLCLHGHVHEVRADIVAPFHGEPKLYVVGAGTFGAGYLQRPPSTPLLYNLLEIRDDLVRVHTRHRRRVGGSWEGWANWPASDTSTKLTYFDINLARQ